MPKLYNVFALDLWHEFPLDSIGSMLVVANNPEEAEHKAMEEFKVTFEQYQIKAAAYEVSLVDGYKIQLVKEG